MLDVVEGFRRAAAGAVAVGGVEGRMPDLTTPSTAAPLPVDMGWGSSLRIGGQGSTPSTSGQAGQVGGRCSRVPMRRWRAWPAGDAYAEGSNDVE